MTVKNPQLLSAGPFSGVRATYRLGTVQPGDLLWLQNCHVDGGAVVSRPGVRLASPTSPDGITAGAHSCQLIHEFIKLDGTRLIVGVWNGLVHTYDSTGDSWTEVLGASDFSGQSITRSTTAQWYAVTFNNQVVFTDGTNVPFMWDGTTNGGLTKLTNVPVFYGQPTVHYAKLFAIKATDRATIVWSEEVDAATGYEQSGYNNTWTLRQTGSVPLTVIRGTNTGLFYWREEGIGVIDGAVTSDFSSTGTDDAISSTIGILSPEGVEWHGGLFWFVDQHGRMWAMSPSGQMQPLWKDMEATFSRAGPTLLQSILVRAPDPTLLKVDYNGATDHIMLHWRGTDSKNIYYVFDANTGRFQGRWNPHFTIGINPMSAATVRLDSGAPAWFMGFENSFAGYIESTGFLGNGRYQDFVAATQSTVSYLCRVTGPAHGWNPKIYYDFQRLDLAFKSGLLSTSTANYTVVLYTSGQARQGVNAASYHATVTVQSARNITEDSHKAVFVSGKGRWGVVEFQFAPPDQAFAHNTIHGWVLTAQVADMDSEGR